jgi:hypothetical protein
MISDWSVLEGVNDLDFWPLATKWNKNSLATDRRCNKQHGCGKERVFKKKGRKRLGKTEREVAVWDGEKDGRSRLFRGFEGGRLATGIGYLATLRVAMSPSTISVVYF